MPVYKYHAKSHTIKDYPTRRDICSKHEEINLTEMDEFLMFPVDMTVGYGRYIYGQKVEGYTLIISGTLKNFQRVQLIISEIDLYFDVLVSSESNKLEIKEIKNMLKGDESKLSLVKAYPGNGFHKEMSTYVRIHFSNIFTRRKHLLVFQEKQYTTASDCEMYMMANQIINRNEWSLGDWGIVKNYESKWVEKYQCYAVYITETNEDGSCSFEPVNRPLSADPPKCKVPTIPPYLSLGYDIEVNGKSFALPTSANIDETIFMLCFGIYRSDQTEPIYTATITNQTYIEEVFREKKPDWDLILCPGGDNNVILAFADILGKFYPEYKLAFNNFGFDDKFICERINQSHYRQFDLFANMALPMPYAHIFPEKRKMIDTLFVETKIKLDGVFDMGDVKKRIHFPGTINIDMMSALKKMNPKDDMLASHGLRSYLERYNLPNKLDISVQDMNFAYENEDAELMMATADYCVVDSISCNRLEQKVSLIASYHATAHLALCSISDAFIRAGGMKVKAVIYCIGKRMQCNYTENPKKVAVAGKFPGAVVFAPLKGLYNDQPTIALDFASLYPSIMRALWISSETYLDSPEKAKALKEEGYDVFPFKLDWKYPVKDEETNVVTQHTVDKKVYYVRKHPDGTDCRGVYPTCLEFLGTTRKLYKKKMASAGKKIAKLQHKKKDLDEEDPELEEEMKEAIIEEKSYNQKQLATKVVMNTLYGALGMKAFSLYNVYLASTITLFGRKALTASSDISIKKGYTRLYGDSVTGNTPLIIKLDDQIMTTRIDELVSDDLWENRGDGKEYVDFDNLEVWEVNRFIKVNQLIRHKTDKPIVRINTHTGVVDTTTDHSLIDHNNQKIKPVDVKVDETRLLRTSFDNLLDELNEHDDTTITPELAYCWGMFMAEGSCGVYPNAIYGIKYSWVINNADLDVLEECKSKLDFETKILDTLASSGCYKLVPCDGHLKPHVLKYRKLFYNDHKEKLVPPIILHSSKPVCEEFLRGFFDGDGCQKDKAKIGCSRFDQKGQETALGLWLLVKKCGYKNISVNTREDKVNIFRLSYTDKIQRKQADIVKKKYNLHNTTDYVYDLSTETHRFHAGVGEIVVHNTDSVFLLPKKEEFEGMTDPRQKVTHCQDLAEALLVDIRTEIRRITRRDTNVIDMALDKLLYPALYMGKKKYCAIIWEGDKEPEEYISGLEFKKRGKSQLLRDLSQRVVTESMEFGFKKDMLEFVTDTLQDGVNEIKEKEIQYFVKNAKYRPGKLGSANMFIARMKVKETIDPILYQIPDPNVTFQYIVTSLIDPFMSNGNKRSVKKTDQWEFLHVVEQLKMKPDYSYYLTDVIGSLARFINYYEQFQPINDEASPLDMEEMDKKSQKNAEKYLKEKLAEFNNASNLGHTIVKRQRKFINSMYIKTFSGLTDYFVDAYDNNIDVDGFIQYLLTCTRRNIFPIEAEIPKTIVEQKIKKGIEYLISMTSIMERLYREYVGQLDAASREQKDLLELSMEGLDIEIINPTDIIDTINDLIKYQSILLTVNRDSDPVADALYMVFGH